MMRKNDILKSIKYIFSSGSSFILDLVIFTLFNILLKNTILSTIFARIISSFYNYMINSRIVFQKYNNSSIYKYYLLVIVQMFISGYMVLYISTILVSVNQTIIKFFVDLVIFVVNYFIQKEVIFK